MSDTIQGLLRRAFEARRENRLNDARRDLVEAVELCRRASGPVDLARTLTRLGQIERDLHHGDPALELYQEAAALYRDEGDSLKLAHTIRHVADIHQEEGRPELADALYQEALELYRREARTAPLDLANAIRGFAILKQAAGEDERAQLLWEEARKLYAAVDVRAGVEESNRRLALLGESRESG